jgi:diaminopimelate decarboxylase
VYDVTGSLCENNEKFAIRPRRCRSCPGGRGGDPRRGRARLRHGLPVQRQAAAARELLLREDGVWFSFRRAETLDDYFATLDFDALASFGSLRRGGSPVRALRDRAVCRILRVRTCFSMSV